MIAQSTLTLPPDIEREIEEACLNHVDTLWLDKKTTREVSFKAGAREFYTKGLAAGKAEAWNEAIEHLESETGTAWTHVKEMREEGKSRGYLK